MLDVKDASIHGGNVTVEAGQQRFLNCYFQGVTIVTAKPTPSPIFLGCLFEDCDTSGSDSSAFNYCVFDDTSRCHSQRLELPG